MTLWLLESRPGARAFRDPYGKIHRMVVRAPTEERARGIATDEGSQEVTRQRHYGPRVIGMPPELYTVVDSPWQDAQQTTCVELRSEGQAGMVICDQR